MPKAVMKCDVCNSRSGINITKRKLRRKDMVISPLIEQGQSPYQIVANHPELDMSVCTMYTYLDSTIILYIVSHDA